MNIRHAVSAFASTACSGLLLGSCLLLFGACQSGEDDTPARSDVGESGTEDPWAEERNLAETENVARELRSAAFHENRVVVLQTGRDWAKETPSSRMRLVQMSLPGEAGPASLVVYWFGGTAGSVEANLQRWAGEWEVSDNDDPLVAADISVQGATGQKLTRFRIEGTYVAPFSPRSAERYNEADWSADSGILELSFGALYFKIVGPTTTLESNRVEIDRMYSEIAIEAETQQG